MKPTQGELWAGVELFAKKKRSVKCKDQDPPMGSLPAWGKVPKLGVSDPPLVRPSSGEGAGVVLFGRGVRASGRAASLVLRCRSQGFFEKGYRASSKSPSYLCLEPFGSKRLTFPPYMRRCGR